MLSKRPGETFDPVTATRIGANASRGFSSSRSATARSACSIASAVNGSASLEPACAASQGRFRPRAPVGLDVLEEEAREPGVLAERRDLLLDERDRPPDERLVPVVALLSQVGHEPVGVLVGRKLAEVHAVQPVELLEVEDGRARADAVEGEPLDELLA